MHLKRKILLAFVLVKILVVVVLALVSYVSVGG